MKAGILIGHLKHGGNEAALIRTAETFGIGTVHVLGKRRKKYGKSQGAANHVTFTEHLDPDAFVEYARIHNLNLVVVENTSGAEPIENGVNYPVNPVFIPGHEALGVPSELVEAAARPSDRVIKITQSRNSYVRCLNTAAATAIVIHDWFRTLIQRDRDKQQPYGTEAENAGA